MKLKRIVKVLKRPGAGVSLLQRCLAALAGSSVIAQAPPVEAAPRESSRDSAPPSAQHRREVIPYKQVAEGNLTLHIVHPDSKRFQGPRPAVVFFHGGGWRTGSPAKFAPFSEALAAEGVVGISVRYRLLKDSEALPRDAILDGRSAMRWVKQNAARLNVDPQKIAASGASAGGLLALMTAMDARADDPGDDLKVSPRPSALILLNSPLDLSTFKSAVPQEMRRQFSPIELLRPDFPPSLIVQGSADQVVPVSQVHSFQARAKELGVKDMTVRIYPGRRHSFFNAGKGDGADFRSTVQDMSDLLRRLGWVH